MIDKFIEYILKKNRPLGIILIGVVVIIFLVDVVNNFIQIGQLTSNPLWLPFGLIISLIFGIAIGWDSEGYYSPRARKLARLLVLVSIQTLVLFVWGFIGANFHSYENVFRWGFIVFVMFSAVLFFVIERMIQKSKNFNILFFEFSDGGGEEKPKDRSITEFVQQGLRERFKGTKVVIIPIGDVIIDGAKAIARGKNAEAAAVIWGIYTKRLKNIILRLGFEATKRPEYYQPVDLGTKVLPLEELDTGHLDILIQNDYANVINFLIGLSEYSSGDFKTAINTFASLLAEASNIAGFSSLKPEILLLYLGNSYYSSGDIYRGKSCFEQTLAINPNNPKALHNIGVIEYQEGKLENSIETFSKAISLDDQLFVAYRNRAFVLILKKQYQEALGDLSKCLSLKPFDVDALKFSAVCYSNLGNHTAAIKYFRFAHRTQRHNINLIFDLADEYIKTKNFLKAFALPIFQMYKIDECSRILGYLGDISREINYKRLAIVFYTSALIFDKKRYSLYYARSRARSDLGNLSSAKRDLEKAIQIEPQMTKAYLELGDLHMRQNNYTEAEKYYSKGIVLSPNSPIFYLPRAQALLLLHKYNEVIDDCENYMRLKNSENSKIYELLGYSFWGLAKFDQAIDHLGKVYQLLPSQRNRINLANVHLAYVVFLLDSDGDSKEISHHYKIAQSLTPLAKLDKEHEEKIITIIGAKD